MNALTFNDIIEVSGIDYWNRIFFEFFLIVCRPIIIKTNTASVKFTQHIVIYVKLFLAEFFKKQSKPKQAFTFNSICLLMLHVRAVLQRNAKYISIYVVF